MTTASHILRRATALERRNATDLAKWEAVDHNKTDVYDFDAETPEDSVFGGVTSSILAPTVTDGPYYIWGEGIRQNVVESKYCTGVPLHLEVQYYGALNPKEHFDPGPDLAWTLFHH